MAKRKDELTEEQKKALGQTDSQQAIRKYHETTFQKKDPITGEDRDLDERIPPARVDRGETVEGVAEQFQKSRKGGK